MSPIPKCNDDQAGNWQGAEGNSPENFDQELALKIRPDLI